MELTILPAGLSTVMSDEGLSNKYVSHHRQNFGLGGSRGFGLEVSEVPNPKIRHAAHRNEQHRDMKPNTTTPRPILLRY